MDHVGVPHAHRRTQLSRRAQRSAQRALGPSRGNQLDPLVHRLAQRGRRLGSHAVGDRHLVSLVGEACAQAADDLEDAAAERLRDVHNPH